MHSWNPRLWSVVAEILADPPRATPAPPSPRRPRQHQTRLAKAKLTALVTDYVSGMSVAAVAKKYNIDLKTATKHLTDAGISIRQNKVALPASEHATLLELAASGLSNAEIGRRYGCTRQAVHLALKRARRTLSSD